MTKVSVVITTCNMARYTAEAVDSVLAQTYTDYEVIVIDDGSTDDTKGVLKPYMDRTRYIYQENAGVGAARNTGIRLARPARGLGFFLVNGQLLRTGPGGNRVVRQSLCGQIPGGR